MQSKKSGKTNEVSERSIPEKEVIDFSQVEVMLDNEEEAEDITPTQIDHLEPMIEPKVSPIKKENEEQRQIDQASQEMAFSEEPKEKILTTVKAKKQNTPRMKYLASVDMNTDFGTDDESKDVKMISPRHRMLKSESAPRGSQQVSKTKKNSSYFKNQDQSFNEDDVHDMSLVSVGRSQ